ncbi:hypothetical protein HOE67_00985 [Candidatus Peregrinibacteria bacterium]|jgi:hypothetical protein|nr:hypothetical protein [Candidatus Peregrinibacteria bacterium]MBT4055662.1 hypothetical protein [Candidatus Peregrinibacteria bacterium]
MIEGYDAKTTLFTPDRGVNGVYRIYDVLTPNAREDFPTSGIYENEETGIIIHPDQKGSKIAPTNADTVRHVSTLRNMPGIEVDCLPIMDRCEAEESYPEIRAFLDLLRADPLAEMTTFDINRVNYLIHFLRNKTLETAVETYQTYVAVMLQLAVRNLAKERQTTLRNLIIGIIEKELIHDGYEKTLTALNQRGERIIVFPTENENPDLRVRTRTNTEETATDMNETEIAESAWLLRLTANIRLKLRGGIAWDVFFPKHHGSLRVIPNSTQDELTFTLIDVRKEEEDEA